LLLFLLRLSFFVVIAFLVIFVIIVVVELFFGEKNSDELMDGRMMQAFGQ
jgi:hypothetical protein